MPRLIGDRYELQALLASGGMGRVWRARDTLLQRPVAVKILRSEFTGDPKFLGRFRAEAQHTAVLTHPNIASVFDYGELTEGGEHLAYLVMELVDGESLAALLVRVRRLDVPLTLSLLRQTAAALAAAHAAGVVHRDVKPGNVLMGANGTVKITDFGIAWSASSVPLTQTGQVIGTAHYLSPEQAAGAKATPASDVYALGAVAYECLAGRRVFEGENSVQVAVKQIREEPEPLPADLPLTVRRLVERAMCKDPAERFPDGAALLAAVDDVLAGRPPVPSSRTGTAVMPVALAAAAPRGGSSSAGRRALVRVALGALAVLAVLAVAGVLLQRDPATPAQGTTTEETSPPVVAVAAEDYLNRPVGEVQAALIGKGLQVTVVPVETADVPAGQVTAIDPAGDLAPGQTVAVTYAVPPVAVPTPAPPVENTGDDEADNGDSGDSGNGNGDGKDKKDKDD
jgi:eukaryotic-like serine/threonine-protein kinase